MDKKLIEIKNLKKSFGENEIIKSISLDVFDGEFLTLLGPSGCGKTTILRILAGFEYPTEGEILLDGENLITIPANKRNINTVFQSYALFPHLSVRDNIGYGMKIKKVPLKELNERVDEMLALTSLEVLANRKPLQLSGGQQQRVAIARSLVNRPKVLLLDEPLGALDLGLRKKMQIELKRLQKKLGTTYIYVTHDQEEALTISDRIVVMNAGKIEQCDKAKTVYQKPASKFVTEFLGETNLIDGEYCDEENQAYFKIQGRAYPVEKQEKKMKLLSVRPENLKVCPPDKDGLKGQIVENVFMGENYRIGVQAANGQVLYILQKEPMNKGSVVGLTFDADKVSGI
ncbi:MAG TPA: spermidine/putrescine ABC transporter ATP-binding protein [Lachnospiraceae bacterium]|nr:spermidine/putrescine ABC transporter ATP-binding protein [Lachnospiraceae bacterium]